MKSQQNLDLITRNLKQSLVYQHIWWEDLILNVNGWQ